MGSWQNVALRAHPGEVLRSLCPDPGPTEPGLVVWDGAWEAVFLTRPLADMLRWKVSDDVFSC